MRVYMCMCVFVCLHSSIQPFCANQLAICPQADKHAHPSFLAPNPPSTHLAPEEDVHTDQKCALQAAPGVKSQAEARRTCPWAFLGS